MLRSSLGSVCLACRISGNAGAAPGAVAYRPQLSTAIRGSKIQLQSSLSFSTSNARQATRRERTPSRMVLSDRVGRSTARDGDKKPRRRVDGPFAGMNRTVANFDPETRSKLSRDNSNNNRSSKNGREGGKKLGRDGKGFKALNMQRSLASIGYGHRTTVKAKMQEVDSFDQFDLLPQVKDAVLNEALKGMLDIKPTPVQRLAIPALLGQTTGARSRWRTKSKPADSSSEAASPDAPPPPREEFLLAAETGSGKTLAYLVPAFNALKEAEASDPDIIAYNQRRAEERALLAKNPGSKIKTRPEPHPTMSRPRVVILVPTAELVDQVGRVAKSLSHVAKARTRMISANMSATMIENDVFSPAGIDILISTPHLLASIAESHPNILSRVSHLVVDEADSLLDRSFSEVTTPIIDRALPSIRQLVLCSATIPRRLDNYLASRFPNMRRITTPNLHAIPRRVQLGVIDVARDPYRGNKNIACADAIWSIGKEAGRHEGPVKGQVDVRRIMVFVNEREKTQEVAEYLKSKGIDAVALHRDTSEERQSEMLASFTSNETMSIPTPEGGVAGSPRSSRTLPNTKVIVATDLASRGIDTLAVRHVVLYDVPHTTIDFIHRLGRAGRMGRRGRGIVLVGNDDRKDIVAEVKESMFMGQALV